MAKMRPGEKKKVDFNIKGQPIGVNRACLANYCGALVRDPLNAPLYEVKVFSQISKENKEKMWQLVLVFFILSYTLIQIDYVFLAIFF